MTLLIVRTVVVWHDSSVAMSVLFTLCVCVLTIANYWATTTELLEEMRADLVIGNLKKVDDDTIKSEMELLGELVQ